MASDTKKPHQSAEDKSAGKSDREDRLASALRDNLRKRKEQSRARAADPVPDRAKNER